MVAYAIIQVQVEDAAKFDQYKAQVPETIRRYDGKYLARGGSFEVLDGEWPTERTVLLEFPSLQRAKQWYDSPEYSGPKALREQCATVNVVLLEGI